MAVDVVDGLEVIDIDHGDIVVMVILVGFLELLHHVVAVEKVREAVLVRAVGELSLRGDDHLDHDLRVERHKAQDNDRVRDEEHARDTGVDFIDGFVKERVAGRHEIRGDCKCAVECGVDGIRLQPVGHVFRVEDDRDHGHAVKVESEGIAEAECREAHVEREPPVDEADIQVEHVFLNEIVTSEVHARGRNTEPDQEPRVGQIEKAHQTKHQDQYHGVDEECQFFDLFLYHISIITGFQGRI